MDDLPGMLVPALLPDALAGPHARCVPGSSGAVLISYHRGATQEKRGTPMKYLTTKSLPLPQLEPYPGNARRGDVGKIRESLRANGQYRSLIVRKSDEQQYTVLAGNHTLLAMIAEGTAKARCEVIECDDAEALRINLVDNRTSELGGYDDDALAALLKDLDDLTGTGYTADDTWMFPPPPVPTLDELSEEYGEPEPGDLRVTLKFSVEPKDRQLFYELTEGCSDPNNESARFAYLLGLAGFNGDS